MSTKFVLFRMLNVWDTERKMSTERTTATSKSAHLLVFPV